MSSKFLVIVIPLLLNSCEEDFNPKVEFTAKYALFAVVENNPPLYKPSVSAVVVKTYDTEGFDPAYDHQDNSISDCKLTITINDEETSLTPLHSTLNPAYSYIGGFNARSEELVIIKAELPNGKVLSSQTNVPGIIEHLDFSYQFSNGIHSGVDRFAWGNNWKIEWDSFNDDLYFPQLILEYAKSTPDGLLFYSKEVPMKYVKKDGVFEPVYPTYTWNKNIEYSYDCFDSVMTNISSGDSMKINYVILDMRFGIIEFERNLASFYTSTHGYLDSYSIRLDETVYSNVTGGFGVFGACAKTFEKFKMNRKYVESYGYRTE